jgi:hypothetical protein
VLLAALLVRSPTAGAVGGCPLTSPAHRVTLLELYTSEGCDSCPPADRWLSAIAGRGFDANKVVPLAFHVDYWNQLGWNDRFSDARFSERQRAIAERQRSGVIYTPQFVVDGRDWRPAQRDESLTAVLATITGQPARAQIRAQVARETQALLVRGEVSVPEAADRDAAEVWIALFENGLSTDVRAGENGGKTLHHDYVVREIVGPLRMSSAGTLRLERRLRFRPTYQPEQTGVAIFLQRRDSGEILQAVALPGTCSS